MGAGGWGGGWSSARMGKTERRRCETCGKHATFGLPNERKRQWCGAHKPDGAEDLATRRCECCSKAAAFGLPHERKRRWCKAHAVEGAVDVATKRCERCDTIAIYGLPDVRKRRWCTAHKPEGAIYLNYQCTHEKCMRQPSFGMPGDVRASWCVHHKVPGAVNVISKRCEHPGCTVQCPSYGVEGRDVVGRWCSVHKPPEAVDIMHRRCKAPGCPNISIKYDYCAQHDTDNLRETRVREIQVANHLRASGTHWTSWDMQLKEKSCGKYRPDFAFETPTHVVILEVDEFQHARPGAEYTCENARMLDIFGSYGGTPVVFIRFNPDPFVLAGVKTAVPSARRLSTLVDVLRPALAEPPAHALTIARLFYDSPAGHLVTWTRVSPDDPSFVEHPL